MSEEEVRLKLEEEFLLPYSDKIKWVDTRIRRAVKIWNDWGAKPDFLYTLYSDAFGKVLQANSRLLTEVGKNIKPIEGFISPVIDFSNAEESLRSLDRLTYQFQLEKLIWLEIDGWVSDENVGTEVITSVPVFYDIWLQAFLICENPEEELSKIAP